MERTRSVFTLGIATTAFSVTTVLWLFLWYGEVDYTLLWRNISPAVAIGLFFLGGLASVWVVTRSKARFKVLITVACYLLSGFSVLLYMWGVESVAAVDLGNIAKGLAGPAVMIGLALSGWLFSVNTLSSPQHKQAPT